MLYIYPPTPVSVTVPPLGILVDGVPTEINQNTSDPSLSQTMPTLSHFMKNGSQVVVNYDGVTKANINALPVMLVGADGTEATINVTTGDLSIQTSHTGANPDSMQIGDGTTIWQMEAVTGKGLVKDEDSITELQAILAKIIAAPSTEAKQDDVITALGNLLVELELKADLTETQPVSLASQPLPIGSATEAKQNDLLTAIGLLAKLTDTQPISAASLPLPVGAATSSNQTTAINNLASLNSKLPSSVGSKPDSGSLAVTQSTEDKAIQAAILAAIDSQTVVSTLRWDTDSSADGNISNSAETEVIADIGGTAGKEILVSCEFGKIMSLFVNSVVVATLPKGGNPNTPLKLTIPANASIGFQSLEDTVTSGNIVINIMG